MTTAGKSTKKYDTLKAVTKLCDMDRETKDYIESLCQSCIVAPKEFYKDNQVYITY